LTGAAAQKSLIGLHEKPFPAEHGGLFEQPMKKDTQICSRMLPPHVRAQPHLRPREASACKLIDAAFVHEKSYACPLAKVRYRTYLLPEDCQNASRRTSGPQALSEIPFLKSQSSLVDMFFHLERNIEYEKTKIH
jgi:hypothetical protein